MRKGMSRENRLGEDFRFSFHSLSNTRAHPGLKYTTHAYASGQLALQVDPTHSLHMDLVPGSHTAVVHSVVVTFSPS